MNSHFNNTTSPLAVGESWKGGNEITQPNNLICVSVNSSSYCLVTIKQTNDLINYDQVDSYNVSPATDGRYIQEFCKCTYAHVEVLNVDSVAQSYLSVSTTFTNQTQVQETIAVSNLPIVNEGHSCVAVSVDGWTTGASIPVVFDTDSNTVKIDSSANTVSIAPSQSINIVNSGYQYNTGVLSIPAGGKLTSSAVNINNYNLVDVYLLFENSTDPSDAYFLQISPDNGTTWFNSNYFTLAGSPSQGTLQLNTSATQVRVKGSSLFANNVNIWITAKST